MGAGIEEIVRTRRRSRDLVPALEGFPDGIVVLDMGGRLIGANRAFLELIDVVLIGEIEGRAIEEVLNAGGDGAAMVRALRKEGRFLGEMSARRTDGSRFFVEVSASVISEDNEGQGGYMLSFRDVTERKRAEKKRLLRETQVLTERVKELDCLYSIANLVQQSGISLDDILQGTADLIPEGWQYPEITCARVILDDQTSLSQGFRETEWRQSSELSVNGHPSGRIEVFYKEEMPEADEGPFLAEERRLIDAVAERLGRIVERKCAKQELLEQKALLDEIFDGIQEGIGIVDEEERIVFCNPAFGTIFGEDPDRLVGRNLEEFCPPEAREIIRKETESRRSGEVSTYEIPILTEAGEEKHIRVTISPRFDPEGRYIGAFGAVLDMTDRKQAEAALRDSQRKYYTLFNQIADPVFIYDRETGRFLDCNRAVPRIYGYSKDELRKMTPLDLHPEEERERVASNLKVRNVDRPKSCAHLTKDGRRIDVSIVTDEIIYDGGPAWISIVRDVTEVKRWERKRKELLRELKRSNGELQQFAYVASHDLQEPLRMVASYVQLLGRRYKGKLDQDADEFIEYAVDGAARMQSLINDLLSYSRVGTRGKPPEACEMKEVLGTALKNLQVAVEDAGASVTHDSLPGVNADRGQIVQLLQNLIGNALKFRGEEAPRVHVSCEDEGDEWTISVKDNGIGISEEYRERIFLIFQRLHNRSEYEGTGIGLAVCKKIVERHGGRIWVESEPGKGSTFFFTLPKTGGLSE
jgi:PAS domain S-box-containing protein